jgi:hypothetical protein
MKTLSSLTSYGGCLYCDTSLIKRDFKIEPIDYKRRDYFKDFTPGEYYYCPSCGRITKFINSTERSLLVKEIKIQSITFWVAKNTRNGKNYGKCWLYLINKSNLQSIPSGWKTKSVDLLNWKLNDLFNFDKVNENINYARIEVETWLKPGDYL